MVDNGLYPEQKEGLTGNQGEEVADIQNEEPAAVSAVNQEVPMEEVRFGESASFPNETVQNKASFQDSAPYQGSGSQDSAPYQGSGSQNHMPYQDSNYQNSQSYQNGAYPYSGYQSNAYYDNGAYSGAGDRSYNGGYQQYNGAQPYRNSYQDNSRMELEEPVKISEWVLAMVLMMIPCVNIIMMFVWAFSSTEKKSKSNFFKAYLIFFGISMGVMLLIWIAIVFFAMLMY